MKFVAALVLATTAFAVDNIPADTSANATLNGKYWVRQVLYLLKSDGKPDSAFSIAGAITFDGRGGFSFAGQVQSTIAARSNLTRTGSYRVGRNGLASMDSLLFVPALLPNEQIVGAVGANGIFVGAATEGVPNDMFIAIPAGTSTANSALTGTFWIGHLDIPGGNGPAAKNSLFQVTSNGQGSFGNVTVTGRDAAQRNTKLSQSVTAANYNFASDGAATLTFPAPAGVAANAALFTGTKILYVSGDGNYVLGGDPTGYDIFFGMRPKNPSVARAAFPGLFYFSAVDSDFSDAQFPLFLSEYGSVNGIAPGKTFWHQRTSPFNFRPYDYAYDGSGQSTLNPTGSFSSTYYESAVAADDKAIIIAGNTSDYSLLVGVPAPSVTGTDVFLSPTGVVNAASYSPTTFPVSPGELITLFGSNMANTTTTATTLPFPTTLAGVQVMINDRPSPVYVVSPGQISAIVPYATSGNYAKIQVINNGRPSNTVTVFSRACSIGVFAVPATGSGYGAILHANFSLVTPQNPAKQGEVVLIYLTGLGAVNPTVVDGAAGPTSPLSRTTAPFVVRFDGVEGTVSYNGLAPGAAGLYQMNVQVPRNSPTGDVQLDIFGNNCEAGQVRIPVVAAP